MCPSLGVLAAYILPHEKQQLLSAAQNALFQEYAVENQKATRISTHWGINSLSTKQQAIIDNDGNVVQWYISLRPSDAYMPR